MPAGIVSKHPGAIYRCPKAWDSVEGQQKGNSTLINGESGIGGGGGGGGGVILIFLSQEKSLGDKVLK